MRYDRNFNPEWGYVAPAPSVMRTARLVGLAAIIGATVGAATVFSLLDRPTAKQQLAGQQTNFGCYLYDVFGYADWRRSKANTLSRKSSNIMMPLPPATRSRPAETHVLRPCLTVSNYAEHAPGRCQHYLRALGNVPPGLVRTEEYALIS